MCKVQWAPYDTKWHMKIIKIKISKKKNYFLASNRIVGKKIKPGVILIDIKLLLYWTPALIRPYIEIFILECGAPAQKNL